MVLTYIKYIDLLSALDEHCKCTLPKSALQDTIFNHYMKLYGSFVAENAIKQKQLFMIKHGKSKYNKRERDIFRNFMNKYHTNKRINNYDKNNK